MQNGAHPWRRRAAQRSPAEATIHGGLGGGHTGPWGTRRAFGLAADSEGKKGETVFSLPPDHADSRIMVGVELLPRRQAAAAVSESPDCIVVDLRLRAWGPACHAGGYGIKSQVCRRGVTHRARLGVATDSELDSGSAT